MCLYVWWAVTVFSSYDFLYSVTPVKRSYRCWYLGNVFMKKEPTEKLWSLIFSFYVTKSWKKIKWMWLLRSTIRLSSRTTNNIEKIYIKFPVLDPHSWIKKRHFIIEKCFFIAHQLILIQIPQLCKAVRNIHWVFLSMNSSVFIQNCLETIKSNIHFANSKVWKQVYPEFFIFFSPE